MKLPSWKHFNSKKHNQYHITIICRQKIQIPLVPSPDTGNSEYFSLLRHSAVEMRRVQCFIQTEIPHSFIIHHIFFRNCGSYLHNPWIRTNLIISCIEAHWQHHMEQTPLARVEMFPSCNTKLQLTYSVLVVIESYQDTNHWKSHTWQFIGSWYWTQSNTPLSHALHHVIKNEHNRKA